MKANRHTPGELDIIHTTESHPCFWCGKPCNRLDICYEGYLHKECEKAVDEDLEKLTKDKRCY